LKNIIDINDFDAPASIIPSQYSRTEALVDCGLKNPQRIYIPENTKLTLHFIFIDYLHSVKFKRLSRGYRRTLAESIVLFLKFIAKERYLTDSDVPQKVFEEFLLYIRKNTRRRGNSVGKTVNNAKAALLWYVENTDKTAEKNNFSQVLRVYLAYFPSFQKNPVKPYSSLANLFDACPYNDTQIIKSLRLICCWLLLEYERQRNILLDDSEVSALTAGLKQRDLLDPPVSYGAFSNKKEPVLNEECSRLYAPIINAVLDSNDPVLMERLIQSTVHPFNLVMSLEEMELVLGKLAGSGEKMSPDIMFKRNIYQTCNITTLTYRDLLAPSLVEVFAAQCFFAAERIQSSNQGRLTLADLANNDIGIQVQHVKGRRPKKNRKVVTPVYPRGQLIFDALEAYFGIVQECQSVLPEADKGFVFPYAYKVHLKYGFLGWAKEPASQCFNLLIADGTHTQKALFDDVTEADAQPFLWIVKRMFENNNEGKKQERRYCRLSEEAKKSGKLKIISRRDEVTISKIGLNPTFIGQSRVAMGGGNAPKIKGAQGPSDFSDNKVDAQLTSHTVETKHNTYYDRLNAKETIESRRKFAVQMGDLMEEDAQKMGELMKNTDVIDFEKAKKLLGCGSASEDYKSLINELDEEIGLTSEIIRGDKKIFVANNLTAALIILKMSHIEKQLPQLLNDDPESQSKAKNAFGEKVYLQVVLDRFPENIKKAGETMSKQLDFSFADFI
jgi:hypothetical protein